MNKNPHIKPGYWKDWYWNKGGKEKVRINRKVNAYRKYKKELENVDKLLCKDTSLQKEKEGTP